MTVVILSRCRSTFGLLGTAAVGASERFVAFALDGFKGRAREASRTESWEQVEESHELLGKTLVGGVEPTWASFEPLAASVLAATLLLTLPGLPFVYYGEEIGMTGDKPDPRLRTPMHWTRGRAAGFTTGVPWEPLQPDSMTANVEAQDLPAVGVEVASHGVAGTPQS